MSAPRHLRAAYWQRAAAIRDEWAVHGTAHGPSNQDSRDIAEAAITRLYQRIGRNRPDFTWVRSPREAQPLVKHLPTLDDLYGWIKHPPVTGSPPLATDFAAALSNLRGSLDERITTPPFDPPPPKKKKSDPWPDLLVEDGLTYGIPFIELIRRHVRAALYDRLAHGIYLPGRRLLGEPSPVCWYGQQEAHWIAYYDVWRRLGLATYSATADAELDTWQAIAHSSSWFWPDEKLVVISQKPIAPMTFADGWTIKDEAAAVKATAAKAGSKAGSKAKLVAANQYG